MYVIILRRNTKMYKLFIRIFRFILNIDVIDPNSKDAIYSDYSAKKLLTNLMHPFNHYFCSGLHTRLSPERPGSIKVYHTIRGSTTATFTFRNTGTGCTATRTANSAGNCYFPRYRKHELQSYR